MRQRRLCEASIRSATIFIAGVLAAGVISVNFNQIAYPGTAWANGSVACIRGWVTAFSASPSNPTVGDARVTPVLAAGEQTYRSTVTPSVSGHSIRLRLTNRFRPTGLTLGRVTVAQQRDGPRTVGTPRKVTFSGASAVTIQAGEDIISDPINISVRASRPLSVSAYVRGQGIAPTGHFSANSTSYYTLPGSGDAAFSRSGREFVLTTTALPLVSALDVLPAEPSAAIVAFGDSITDGYMTATKLVAPESGAAIDHNVRYTDFLQRRLGTKSTASVVNAGISGNQVSQPATYPMYGPAGRDRLRRDALELSGVSDVVLLEGINDVANGATYSMVVHGLTEMMQAVHARGISVHIGTVMPDGNNSGRASRLRLRINDWIRHQTIADSVIDFDAALRDPVRPYALNSKFAGPDGLHPNAAGYRAMADAVPLRDLRAARCTSTTKSASE